jgi:N-acetyl-anhydromuramyl-L-alanine amidase AmpD
MERKERFKIMFKKFNYFVQKMPRIFALGLSLILFVSSVYAEQTIDMSKAVIHHTASPDISAKEIRNYHMEHNGWDDIGYHFVIRASGAIETGRDLHKIGAHAKGRNNYVGIVLTGYDNFTKEQIASLISLLKVLGIKYIERHHEECPGVGLDLDYIRKEMR